MLRTAALIRVADEVWIATALLHREHADRPDFSLQEIAARLEHEAVEGTVRRGVYPHLSVHCVANTRPNPARHRYLYATGPSRRRLFRSGDRYDPAREGGKVMPRREDIPGNYHGLLDWYEREWSPVTEADPLLELARRQRRVWKGVDPDKYVRSLREDWT